MEQGVEKILAKHGCLYMKDDYKALFEELEAYYKPTEAVKNNAVLPLVSNSLLSLDGKTIPVTFHVSKFEPKIDIDLSNDC